MQLLNVCTKIIALIVFGNLQILAFNCSYFHRQTIVLSCLELSKTISNSSQKVALMHRWSIRRQNEPKKVTKSGKRGRKRKKRREKEREEKGAHPSLFRCCIVLMLPACTSPTIIIWLHNCIGSEKGTFCP